MQHCKNCGHQYTGKYCPNCGQKAAVGDLTLHDLFHELWHSLTHTDSGIIRLLKELYTKPKNVYLNYFSGQRKKYFSPVTFFLLSAGILLFIGIKVFDYEDYLHRVDNPNGFNEMGRYNFLETKFKALVLLPLQIILTSLLFFKQYNLAKNIVFWLFLNGLLFTTQIIFSVFSFAFISHRDIIENIVSFVQLLLIFWHLVIVFGNRKWYNILLCIIITNCILLAQSIISWYLLFGNDFLQRTGSKNMLEFLGKFYSW
jgi:Protein of unknown function (DUF3667)